MKCATLGHQRPPRCPPWRGGVTRRVTPVMWPGLSAWGEAGTMSGPCREPGSECAPTTPDVALLPGALTMPGMPPVVCRADFGVAYQEGRRQAADASRATCTGDSWFSLENTLFIMRCEPKAHDSLSQFLVCRRFAAREYFGGLGVVQAEVCRRVGHLGGPGAGSPGGQDVRRRFAQDASYRRR
jgi:hypothetical protein